MLFLEVHKILNSISRKERGSEYSQNVTFIGSLKIRFILKIRFGLQLTVTVRMEFFC